ncbi:MAG: DsbE family thiol:disulfide interchange protein [Phenylobacterium sp.]|uniref:DsbE family thiol:disulfide interchange protein n=1 Tax=Phenylobacterium sp. TaxID=1871053 RepID=UPI001A48C0CA|nr:DsbE family thiol:disulfide interchange protein [Phenylobacterium sp.]MBL8769793.1 DsbE family thiol:disulfide interchange protein [Phenylobacterium sp.]
MSRWLAALPLVALVALGGLFYFYALRRDPQVQPKALVGREMPDLTLPTLAEGQPVRLRSAVQGPALVNFYASWCAPCEVEHPVLMGLKGRGVRVVGVAYKDAPSNAQAFLTRLGDPFAEVLVDRDGRAGVEFGVTGVPETYLVGADGKVIEKHTGPLTEADATRLANRAR